MLRARDIPNMITFMRLLLVPPVVWLILQHRFDWALWLFLFAGLSDGVDGFLAKQFGWTSRLGGLLDPVADKLLLVCCYVALGWVELVEPWIVLLVVARDIIIFSGALAYHFLYGRFEASPTLASKFNTVTQILLVLLLLWSSGVQPDISWELIAGMKWLVVLTTIISGIDYVYTWGKKAWKQSHDIG